METSEARKRREEQETVPEQTVPCPTCNAKKGEPCRTTVGGLDMRLSHLYRRRAYAHKAVSIRDNLRRGI